MAELFLKLAQKNCAHVLDRILQKLDYFDLLALQEVDKFFNVLVLRYLSRLDVIWIPSSDYEHGALRGGHFWSILMSIRQQTLF